MWEERAFWSALFFLSEPIVIYCAGSNGQRVHAAYRNHQQGPKR